MNLQKEISEVDIVVPWGHVAAKIWGHQSSPMVLVIHGVMDNAGSFDRLMPLLPNNFCYICIDLPGHGKSSQLPPFFPIHSTNFLIVYKLVMKHFKQEKYIVMGHSYGGQIGFLFAQIYPELVEKLIMLDTIHLFPVHSRHFAQSLRDKLEYCIDLDEKFRTKARPTYTYEEALNKLQFQRHSNELTREAAEALLTRSIAPAEEPGRYYFTLDQRIKQFTNPFHDFRYIIESLNKSPVRCPVLMVLGRDSEMQQLYMKTLTNFLKKLPNFRIQLVNGNHDVHNTDPEIVAPYVSKFLLMKKAKL